MFSRSSGQGVTMHSGPRVLVVDDEDAVRSAVAASLDNYASDIQQADSVKSALCCLAEDDFDVVVCDMYMPEAHGLELIKKMREQQRDVAFVVMTGNPELPDVIAALRLRAAGFLKKPFCKEQLVDALDTAYGTVKNQRRIANRLVLLSSEVEEKSKQLQEALANLETCAHSFRVRAYTSYLAEQVKYPADLMVELETAALLHDVGKISVPDSILL